MQVEIRGTGELVQKLNQIADINQLRPTLRESAEIFREEMTDYPPPPVGSRYVRTLTLGRLWTVTPVFQVWNGLQVKVGNVTPYVRWVQSRLMQARVHRGRWRTEYDVLVEQAARRDKLFRNRIEKLLGG